MHESRPDPASPAFAIEGCRTTSTLGLMPTRIAARTAALPALLALIALFAVSPDAGAQAAYTWNGGSGSWFSAANWSPTGVPGAPDTARVASGSPEVTRDTTVAFVEFGGSALTGDGKLTVTDTLRWSAGNMDGRQYAATAAISIPTGAVLLITGDAEKGLRGRDILNDGTTVWEGTGALDVKWSTRVENHAGATFDIRNDAAITRSNGTLDFINDGVLVKSAGTGTTSYTHTFGSLENHGTIRVEAGTLLFSLATSSFTTEGDGAFEIESGATLRFNSADYRFGSGSTVSGAGTLRVTGGVVEIGSADMTGPVAVSGGSLEFIDPATPSELPVVALSGGKLGTRGTLNLNELLTWTGGSLGTDTDGVINLIGGASAEGTGDKTFGGATYNNTGTFTWSGTGNLVVNTGGTFNNVEGADFDIQSDALLTRTNGTLTFVNDGVVVKSAGTGETRIQTPFAPFNNDGEVRVESGTLTVAVNNSGSNSTDTGAWIADAGAALGFSSHERIFTETASIGGAGTVTFAADATITNRATIRPGSSPGTLSIGADYPAPAPEGVLEIEVGGTTPDAEHDVLHVTNIANLGGTLRLVLSDGFEPTGDETFTVITALAVQGNFDAVEAPEGYVADVAYNAQDVAVQIVPIAGCTTGFQADDRTLALYKFDEPLPGTTFDQSGNGFDAIDDGTTAVEGRFCGARHFDGVDDRINMSVVLDTLQGATALTIEYVARSEDGSAVPHLINHGCGNGWYIVPTGSSVSYWIKTTGVGGNCPWLVKPSAPAALDTLWHYYAMTWDGDSLRVYRDGTRLGAAPASGVFLENQSNSFGAWIGHNDFGNTYSGGYADELRISGAARSADEIRELAIELAIPYGTANDRASDPGGAGLPTDFALGAAYPNPFAGRTTVPYEVAAAAHVRVAVYDVLGREVAVLADAKRAAGRYEAELDARGLSAGLYLVRMTADGGFAQTRQVLILR